MPTALIHRLRAKEGQGGKAARRHAGTVGGHLIAPSLDSPSQRHRSSAAPGGSPSQLWPIGNALFIGLQWRAR
jgi:hypothetical protein